MYGAVVLVYAVPDMLWSSNAHALFGTVLSGWVSALEYVSGYKIGIVIPIVKIVNPFRFVN